MGQDLNSTPKVVDKVDLSKYTGLWYEIARIPNRFQEDCAKGTTAKYTLNDEQEIEVINSCIETDGEKNIAEGIARVVDKNTNAKLEVSFVSIFGLHLFWGDYWIIGLDKNYEYAVVGHPERKYGWILSRTKKLTMNQMDEVKSILKKNGYDFGRFQMTDQ